VYLCRVQVIIFQAIQNYSILIIYAMGYADGKQHEDKFCTAKYCRNTFS